MLSTTFPSILLLCLHSLTALALPQNAASMLKPGIATREIYDKLRLAQQFNAAVYSNTSNLNSDQQDPVTCPRGSCPLVEAHNTTYLLRFANHSESGLSGFVAVDHTDKRVVLVFRASKPIKDLWTQDTLTLTTLPIYDSAKVHPAFLTAWETVKTNVSKTIYDWRSRNGQQYHVEVVGRGLGGAVAAIASVDLRHAGAQVDLVTFGSPPAGDKAFAMHINSWKGFGDNYRVLRKDEPLVSLPMPGMGFQHYSGEWIITSSPSSKATQNDLVRGKSQSKRAVSLNDDDDDGEDELVFEDFDGSSPWLFDNVLGEVPGGADAAQAATERLTKWMKDQRPISMGVIDKVPFAGEEKPSISIYGDESTYSDVDFENIDLPDPPEWQE